MQSLMIVTLFYLGSYEQESKPVSAKSAAMVLKVKGEVTAESKLGKRPLEPGDLLLPGEIVAAGPEAEALLVFLVPNERRRLKPGGRITLTRDGCNPADAVEAVAGGGKLSAKNLTKVREVEVREGGGVGVVRGAKPSTEARIMPLFGTFVVANRPTFAWPPVEKATGYVIELKDGGGQPLWKTEIKEAMLDYPQKEKPLELGRKYLWTVKARLPDGDEKTVVHESNFKLLLKGEPEALMGVRELAASGAPEDLLLAAAAYEGYGVQDKALTVFEKLARLEPNVARYQQALARYYQHAGRADKAQEALERAKQLRTPLRK